METIMQINYYLQIGGVLQYVLLYFTYITRGGPLLCSRQLSHTTDQAISVRQY